MRQKIFYLLAVFFFLQTSAYAAIVNSLDSSNVWEDESGRSHTFADWKNQSLVLTMVYADCKKTCPMITAEKLRAIHALFTEKKIKAQYLIVTMDPDTDTAPVLLALKKRWKMEGDEWHFLRGSEKASHQFARAIGMKDYWTMDDHIIHDFKIAFFDATTGKENFLDFKRRDVASLLETK